MSQSRAGTDSQFDLACIISCESQSVSSQQSVRKKNSAILIFESLECRAVTLASFLYVCQLSTFYLQHGRRGQGPKWEQERGHESGVDGALPLIL